MHDFRYVGGKLYCEQVSVESLVRKHGTPLYVYSQRTLTDHFRKLDRALARGYTQGRHVRFLTRSTALFSVC